MMREAPTSRHTLSVLVEDTPGVLARVASLFSRRGFNIESLAVGPTEVAGISRMTVVVAMDRASLAQVIAQLDKLINVLTIEELQRQESVEREILLVKILADASIRSTILEIVTLFRVKVIDVGVDSIIIEATGSTDKLAALLRVLEPYGIAELVQSGVVAMARGSRLMADSAP